jgi:hypothetical protein
MSAPSPRRTTHGRPRIQPQQYRIPSGSVGLRFSGHALNVLPPLPPRRVPLQLRFQRRSPRACESMIRRSSSISDRPACRFPGSAGLHHPPHRAIQRPRPIFALPCESACTCFIIPYPCRSPSSASRMCSTVGASGRAPCSSPCSSTISATDICQAQLSGRWGGRPRPQPDNQVRLGLADFV